MTEFERDLLVKNGVLDAEYGALVNRFIRERYSLSEELSILRKREEAPEEFAAYNAFAEECKALAKLEVYGEEVTS